MSYVAHVHRVGQHLLQSADRQGLLQNEGTYGQVRGHILQTYKQHRGKTKLIKKHVKYSTGQTGEEGHQHLTWALDVVSRKQRRFPKPSQDRHSLICSFRTVAVHCRTTWSSCTQYTNKQLETHLFTGLSFWDIILCSHYWFGLSTPHLFPLDLIFAAGCPCCAFSFFSTHSFVFL